MTRRSPCWLVGSGKSIPRDAVFKRRSEELVGFINSRAGWTASRTEGNAWTSRCGRRERLLT